MKMDETTLANLNHSSSDDVDNNASTPTNSVCQLVAENLLQSSKLPECCVLRPHPACALFCAWNGVLVLVYDVFPPALVQTKQILADSVPNLKRENFGSKWPKTTLAGVRDDAGPLLMDDLQRLKNVCMDYSLQIASNVLDPIPIHTLSAG